MLSVLATGLWATLEPCQQPLPGRCLVCVCSNAHAARCWTSVGWKNIQLCCLPPSDVSAGLAVLPEEIPTEIYNLGYMESNCIVVLLLLCRNIGIRDSEQQLLVYSCFGKHFSCCVDSAADPFWGYNVLIPWTILHSMNHACLNCTANTETSLPLHLPPGQAPSQYIHGHTSCSPYALVDVTCFPLMSCFPVGK